MNEHQNIYFDGDWTDGEQRLLEAAIDDAEFFLRGRFAHTQQTIPWVCYCKRLGRQTIYMVHRAGWSQVLHAHGAAELGVKILLLGEQPDTPSNDSAAC